MQRDQILALRLTEDEKAAVERAAREAGAESVSSFVRATLHLRRERRGRRSGGRAARPQKGADDG